MTICCTATLACLYPIGSSDLAGRLLVDYDYDYDYDYDKY